MSRELLQKCLTRMYGHFWADDLCADLREALAAPQPEPVAYLVEGWHDGKLIAHIPHVTLEDAKTSAAVFAQHYTTTKTIPLYATPPAQPTENPWKDAVLDRLASASIDAPTDEFPSRILDRIIEVEVMIALAHVPDGWVMVPKELFPSQRIAAIVAAIQASDSNLVCSADEVSAVYRAMIAASPAAPVVREPLSHKHLLELHAPLAVSLPSGWEWWARVIERAHGITGDRNG